MIENTLTDEQLKSKVWQAADILRGSIDSSDYKNYIFGFLFLKRLSDVFEEKVQKILDEGESKGVAYDPDEHKFFVPEKARWKNIKKQPSQIGDYLNKVAAELEDENKSLDGVLKTIDFNSEQLGDVKQRDSTLLQLVQHFSAIPLRNSDIHRADALGDVYEYLIEKFADDSGKKGGEFYTPKEVVKLIVELLDPKEGMRICDPTCGSGGMLIESAHHIKESKGNEHNISLFGQEKNVGTWSICKMNMLLHNLPDADIRKGDTIREPKLLSDGQLVLFDRVIANPPFSLDRWGIETAQNDGFGRFIYGIPPKSKGDFAFIEHMIATTNQDGMVGVVVPHGVLFRGASEGRIRTNFIEKDLIEAVVGLPSNLFYGTGIPAAILVFNKSKSADRRNKVLFIDSSQNFESGKNQNKLRSSDISKIVNAFKDYKTIDKYSRVVEIKEIKENDYNLNISRYVDTTPEEEPIDIKATIKELNDIEKEKAEVEKEMNKYLEELGFKR